MNEPKLSVIWRAISLAPGYIDNKICAPKNFVRQHAKVVRLVVVQRNPYAAVYRKQLAKQHQSGPHHRQPLTVLQVVVVMLERAPGVVRRIDEDAFHAAAIQRQQRLERFEANGLYL